MFGGVNDDDAQAADQHQVVPADAALEGSSHAPVDDNTAAPGYMPADDAAAQAPSDAPADDQAAAGPQASDDLLGIKQQALQQLSPLVNHLEQSPEEKFRTVMMLIQASDNAELIKEAYEAAGQITDDKARAQALLDVVNEINYFTQHQDQQ